MEEVRSSEVKEVGAAPHWSGLRAQDGKLKEVAAAGQCVQGAAEAVGVQRQSWVAEGAERLIPEVYRALAVVEGRALD